MDRLHHQMNRRTKITIEWTPLGAGVRYGHSRLGHLHIWMTCSLWISASYTGSSTCSTDHGMKLVAAPCLNQTVTMDDCSRQWNECELCCGLHNSWRWTIQLPEYPSNYWYRDAWSKTHSSVGIEVNALVREKNNRRSSVNQFRS